MGWPSSPAWMSAATGRSSAWPSFHETRIWSTSKISWDEWKFLGNEIVIGSIRILRRDTEAPVALVQIARALYVFVILDERSIVFLSGAAAAGALLHFETWTHDPEFALGISGVVISPGCIYWKAVRRITDEGHPVLAAELFHQPHRKAVIVVFSTGLNMRIARIHSEIDFSGQCLVLPPGCPVVLPEFRCARVERNTVDGHTKEDAQAHPGHDAGFLWFQRHTIGVILLGNTVRIVSIWKPPGLMIGYSVGGDVSVISARRDLDFIFHIP